MSAMHNPFVSIVIPVYNGGATLRRCLTSVLRQVYRPCEVIVVDNGSTDETRKIIRSFQKSYACLRYVFDEKRTRGRARNAGIRHAKGEIIAMTDADCIVPERWIEDIAGLIVAGEESIVMGCEEDAVRNYWTRNIQEANRVYYERNRDGDYIRVLDTKNFAAKTSLLRQYMFDDDLKNLEDYDFSFIIRHKYRIRYLPEVRVKHFHRQTFWQWVPANINRGYWAMKVYKKHKDAGFEELGPMMESISWRNLISFPFWFMYQYIKEPSSRLWFVFVSEVGWRLGLLCAIIRLR